MGYTFDMISSLSIAILAGLGGMLGWGFSEFATKKSVDSAGTIPSLVWAHIFGTILLFGILISRLFVTHAQIASIFPVSWSSWLGLLFFGVLQATVYYFAYKAFEKGQVSVLSPIFASFSGLVALLSILVFGEVAHLSFILALALIFGGVLLINLDLKQLNAKRIRIAGVPGLKEILIATILATIWTLGWNAFSNNADWLVYTTFMFVFMTIAAYVIARQANVSLWNIPSGAWMFLLFIAIGEVIGYLAITLGYATTTHTSIVAIISGASSLPTILLARIFLKERVEKSQVIASAIIICGIVLLSVF
jgi:drug/metabolite transporter (DMT)-like permease